MRLRLAFAALALAGCVTPSTAPPVPPAPESRTATLRLGEADRIAGLSVRALRVEEDSRCPASVQCVHAGTVRLRVALGEADESVLRLREPQMLGSGAWLTLLAACPHPRVPGTIAPSAYRFTLSVAYGPVAPTQPGLCPPAP